MLGGLGRRTRPRSGRSARRGGPPGRCWSRTAGRPGRARAPYTARARGPRSRRRSGSAPYRSRTCRTARSPGDGRRPVRAPRPRPSTGSPGRRARRPCRPAATCARPGRDRCVARSCRAARTPNAPFMPASRSAIGTPTLVGLGPGDRHQAALALGDLVVARALRLRPVVTEPGDRQDDEPRVQRVQPRDREAEPVQHADPEVLHQHVRALDQPGQHVLVGRVLEVEDQRLLVAVRRQEVRRLALGVRRR